MQSLTVLGNTIPELRKKEMCLETRGNSKEREKANKGQPMSRNSHTTVFRGHIPQPC